MKYFRHFRIHLLTFCHNYELFFILWGSFFKVRYLTPKKIHLAILLHCWITKKIWLFDYFHKKPSFSCKKIENHFLLSTCKVYSQIFIYKFNLLTSVTWQYVIHSNHIWNRLVGTTVNFNNLKIIELMWTLKNKKRIWYDSAWMCVTWGWGEMSIWM